MVMTTKQADVTHPTAKTSQPTVLPIWPSQATPENASSKDADLAMSMTGKGSTNPAEMATGRQKLLESKNCFVPAALPLESRPSGR